MTPAQAIKRNIHVGALCLGVAFSQGTLAANVPSTFDVTVNLAAQCVANNSGATTLNFGTYTAFGAAPTTPSPTVALTFNCTRGLTAPTFVLDDDGGVTKSAAAGGTVDGSPASGAGLLNGAGLNYDLSVSGAKTTIGTEATGAAAGTGSADVYTFTVTGSMPTNQAGTCTSGTGTCTGTQTRTLTVSY